MVDVSNTYYQTRSSMDEFDSSTSMVLTNLSPVVFETEVSSNPCHKTFVLESEKILTSKMTDNSENASKKLKVSVVEYHYNPSNLDNMHRLASTALTLYLCAYLVTVQKP